MEGEDPDGVPFEDPNKRHLVAEVSRKVSGSCICAVCVCAGVVCVCVCLCVSVCVFVRMYVRSRGSQSKVTMVVTKIMLYKPTVL